MATTIPNTNISGLLTLISQLVPILNTNFAAANTALSERIVGQRMMVTDYVATGATTNRIPLGVLSPPGSTPWAVMLALARETNNKAADLSVTTRTNFSREGNTLFVFEPQGLVANTKYDLGFLVIFD